MAGKKFSLRLCPETEAILATIPRERRSAYVREAILFYRNQGAMLRKMEEKLDMMIAGLGEISALPVPPGREQGNKDSEPAMDAYLFSGQDDILNLGAG